jgi:hypothetical protein
MRQGETSQIFGPNIIECESECKDFSLYPGEFLFKKEERRKDSMVDEISLISAK